MPGTAALDWTVVVSHVNANLLGCRIILDTGGRCTKPLHSWRSENGMVI